MNITYTVTPATNRAGPIWYIYEHADGRTRVICSCTLPAVRGGGLAQHKE